MTRSRTSPTSSRGIEDEADKLLADLLSLLGQSGAD
jgi:hypothetical protein